MSARCSSERHLAAVTTLCGEVVDLTLAPSGLYAFAPYRALRRDGGGEPFVRVLQLTQDGWGSTPGAYHAGAAAAAAVRNLVLDHGTGWDLDADDTAAFVRFAAETAADARTLASDTIGY